jgi:predicted site-specific integrase-resolvase
MGVVGRSEADLDRQVVRVTAWTTTQQVPVDRVMTDAGSSLNRHGCRFLALLRNPWVTRLAVEHLERFCGFGRECVRAAQGRELTVVDNAGVNDDLVRDMTVSVTSMCARPYGKRAADNRVKRALAAAAVEDRAAA